MFTSYLHFAACVKCVPGCHWGRAMAPGRDWTFPTASHQTSRYHWLSGAHLIKHRMHVRQARRERKVEKKLVSTKLLTRQTEPCGAPASRNGRRSWAAHASGRSLRSWRGRWRPAGCCARPSLGGWSGVTRGTPYHMRSARCSGTAPRSGCDPAAFSTCPTENQVEPAPSPTRKHTHTHTRQTNTLLYTFCGHSKLKIHAYLINTNQL